MIGSMKRILPTTLINEHMAAALNRVREIKPDAVAICTDGEVSFIFDLVKRGSEVFSESFKYAMENKATYSIVIPNRTTNITKYVFDYIQFGNLPDADVVSIKTLVDIYSMADEYRVVGLCEFIKSLLKLIVERTKRWAAIYTYVIYPPLTDIRELAYIAMRDYLRNGYEFTCNICHEYFNIPCACSPRFTGNFIPLDREVSLFNPKDIHDDKKFRCPTCRRFGFEAMEGGHPKINEDCPGEIIIARGIIRDMDKMPLEMQSELLIRICNDSTV